MKTKRILIADDDRGILLALSRRCEGLGLNVEQVTDGLAAMASICKDPPDLAILDINMPAADGLAVFEKLTTDPSMPPLPVVFLTGDRDADTIKQCEAMGAYHVEKGASAWQQLEPILMELLNLETKAARVPPNNLTLNYARNKGASVAAPRILVIDDDADISKAIMVRLRPYGIETLRAFGGMQGYWMALKERPHVIVSDFYMPDCCGNYVLGRLKRHAITKDIPVIILTGRSEGGAKDYSLQREMVGLGASEFLAKPLDIHALLAALRTHMSIPEIAANVKPQLSGQFASR